MVALKKGLPLIQNEHGVAVAFDTEWFTAALDRAARKAGYEDWWLLDEFTAAFAQYLRQDYLRSVIELSSLEKVVRATLRELGYREIAVRFRAVNPFQCMSLADCLGTTGGNKEAAFFRRLAARIKTSRAADVRHFHFYDLQLCVQQLLETETGSAWWSRPLLRARIVRQVRERVQALAAQGTIYCTIR